jgi:GDP-L-fucose synthase
MNLPDAEFTKLLSDDEPPLINIGTGEDLSIREIAELVCKVVGFGGELRFDPSRPDGTPRKLCDVSKIQALGWKATTSLEEGIRRTYETVREQFAGAAV